MNKYPDRTEQESSNEKYTLGEFYKTVEGFKEDLDKAASKARGPREDGFLEGLWDRAKKWGLETIVSEKQWNWFNNIIDRE